MSNYRQVSFAGGAVDPFLRGRDDVQQYGQSVATLENFFVSPMGPALNRPGLRYGGPAITGEMGALPAGTRLVPFYWSDGQGYVLEFARRRMRVWLDGVQVHEIDTPWEAAEDLQALRWAQVGDVMYLTSPTNAFLHFGVRVLTRLADDNWTLENWSLSGWASGVPSVQLAFPDPVADVTEFPRQDWLYAASLIDSNGRESPTPGIYRPVWGLSEVRVSIAPEHRVKVCVPKGDTGSTTGVGRNLLEDTMKFWFDDVWKGLFLIDAEGTTFLIIGNTINSLSVRAEGGGAGYPAAGSYTITAAATKAVIYRGRNELVGQVGVTDDVEDGYEPVTPGSESSPSVVYMGEFFVFYDEGAGPDYSRQPRRMEDPIAAQAALSFFQERLVAAGGYLSDRPPSDTLGRRESGRVVRESPTTLHLSKTGDYRNFDYNIPVLLPDDAMKMELAAYRREEIRSLVPLGDLLIFTDSGVWSLNGARGDPLTPDSIQATPQTNDGISMAAPVVVGGTVLYAAGRGPGIREMRYDDRQRSYVSRDISYLARHLFKGHEIVDIAYQERPYSTLWVLRDDGKLLSATYRPDMETVPWSIHETEGEIKSICVIPEGDEDVLYVAVDRTLGNGDTLRSIEYLTNREIEDVRDGLFLDSALEFNGAYRGTAGLRLLTTPDVGETAEAESTEDPSISDPSFVPPGVGDHIVFYPGSHAIRLRVVLEDHPVTFELLDPIPEGVDLTEFTTDWAVARRVFGGLDHLAGRTVGVLVDGFVHQPVEVSGAGAITLDAPATRVQAGLPYTSILDLMPIPTGSGPSADRGRPKNVSKVTVEVEQARRVETKAITSPLQYGGILSPGDTVPVQSWDAISVEGAYRDQRPPQRGVVEVRVPSKWDVDAAVRVQQTDPLPLTILAISREYRAGGG